MHGTYKFINDSSVNFTAPDSDQSDITATSPATATVSYKPETEIEAHGIVSSSTDHEISTRPPTTIESSSPYIQIIGGVLSGIVIVCVVICIAIVVMVILYKKGQQASFDLTANEAYTEINMQDNHPIDEDDNTSQEIQHSIDDINNVPLEQNAAYIVNSSIVAARNMAYENASDFHEYDYID